MANNGWDQAGFTAYFETILYINQQNRGVAIHMNWTCKKFEDLTPYELYFIIQLRLEVFSVEQNCPYQDADNKDQFAHHLMGMENDKLIAYARILPPDIAFKEISIGRVVNSPSVRGTGLGRLLIQKSLETAHGLYGQVPVKIGAQLYLKAFYESFGFRQTSEIYLEDNIKHIEMSKDHEGEEIIP
jgi:ElaA protein